MKTSRRQEILAVLSSYDEDVISVAGSVRGADTAALLQPANSANFFDLKRVK
jgi:hypothetical protein